MSAQPVEPVTQQQLTPIDPDSDVGRRISVGIGELFDDVAERLRREGKPVPDCIRP